MSSDSSISSKGPAFDSDFGFGSFPCPVLKDVRYRCPTVVPCGVQDVVN